MTTKTIGKIQQSAIARKTMFKINSVVYEIVFILYGFIRLIIQFPFRLKQYAVRIDFLNKRI